MLLLLLLLLFIDPTDELSGTFEHVTYPILSGDESLGFAAHQTSLCSNEYTMVDTPLLSLASNDSLFEDTNKGIIIMVIYE